MTTTKMKKQLDKHRVQGMANALAREQHGAAYMNSQTLWYQVVDFREQPEAAPTVLLLLLDNATSPPVLLLRAEGYAAMAAQLRALCALSGRPVDEEEY